MNNFERNMKHETCYLYSIAIVLTLLLNNAYGFSFDDCHTWGTKDLVKELRQEMVIIPNSRRCQNLSYTDKLVVRDRRLEMLQLALLLIKKSKVYGRITFYSKVLISRDLMNIYGNKALLYIGAK